MGGITTIISDLTEIKDAISSRDWKKAWDMEIKIQQDARDMIFPSGGAAPKFLAASPSEKNQCKALCEEVHAQAVECCREPRAAAEPNPAGIAFDPQRIAAIIQLVTQLILSFL